MAPIFTQRSWQFADLSRTVDDGLLVFECKRLDLPEDFYPEDANQLRADLARVIVALLDLVRGNVEDEEILSLSAEREVLISRKIADQLRSVLGEARLTSLLEEMSGSISSSESLSDDELGLLEQLSKVADVEASASMRPLMRR